jgi:hypothetical protein
MMVMFYDGNVHVTGCNYMILHAMYLHDMSLHPVEETTSFIEISIEAGKLLGGKHEACFVLGMAGIEPTPS